MGSVDIKDIQMGRLVASVHEDAAVYGDVHPAHGRDKVVRGLSLQNPVLRGSWGALRECL